MTDAPPALMDVLVEDCTEREGEIPWLYLDVRGLVTTGIGHLLHSAIEASQLPFMLYARRATVPEISMDFVRVQNMPSGHVADFYKSPLSPTLPPGYASDLCKSELANTYLPGITKLVPDLYQRPPEVARALVTIAYCTGLGGLAKFTHMLASVKRGDYQGIADRKEYHLAPPATDATNNRLRAWFLAAAHQSTV